MVETKTKPADILFSNMLLKTPADIAPLSYGLALWLNVAERDVSNQVLSLAATLLCMLQKYDLSHIDVLNTAENIVFSDEYNNMQPAFSQIMDTFTDKKEILG